MRFSFFTAAAAALLIASPAFAQDITTPWTGYYAGLNAGYGFSGSDTQTTGQAAVNNATVSDGARPAIVRNEMTGFVGGGQFGYNWQDTTGMLYGMEADIQYAEVRDFRTIVTTGTAFPGVRNNNFGYELDYLGTVRGRIGHAWNSSLLYLTGGLAYGGINKTVSFTGPLPAGVTQFTGANSGTKVGYTGGAGYEHALDTNFSVKTEILYYNLGSSNVATNVIAGSGGAGTGYNVRFENEGFVARVGVNYRLGW